MSYQTKQPANWVKSFTSNGVKIEVSDKGALKLTHADNGRFIMCLTPSQAKLLVDVSGDMANFLVSDEYKAIEHQKELNKEQVKIQTQVEREREKAIKNAQAALDKLNAMGITIQPKVG